MSLKPKQEWDNNSSSSLQVSAHEAFWFSSLCSLPCLFILLQDNNFLSFISPLIFHSGMAFYLFLFITFHQFSEMLNWQNQFFNEKFFRNEGIIKNIK